MRPDDWRAAREQRLSRLGGAIKSVWALVQRWWAARRQRLALAERGRNRASPTFLRDTGSDEMVIPGAPFPDRAAEKATQNIQFVYLWNKIQILSVTKGCCRKKENRRTFDRIDGVSAGPGSTEQPVSGGGGSPLLFLYAAGRYARTGAPPGGSWVRVAREGDG